MPRCGYFVPIDRKVVILLEYKICISRVSSPKRIRFRTAFLTLKPKGISLTKKIRPLFDCIFNVLIDVDECIGNKTTGDNIQILVTSWYSDVDDFMTMSSLRCLWQYLYESDFFPSCRWLLKNKWSVTNLVFTSINRHQHPSPTFM